MTLTWYKAKIRSFTVPLRSHAELVTLGRVNGSREGVRSKCGVKVVKKSN